MPAPYELQGQAFAQAIAQQQQEEQLKQQILQSLGFFKSWNPFGAIPHGAGVATMDNQAYVRPGGIDNNTQQLLQTLLGVKRSPFVGGLNTRTKDIGYAGMTEEQKAGVDPQRLQEAIRMHQGAQSLDDLNRLFNEYGREMDYLIYGR